jgi:hypothetical protein
MIAQKIRRRHFIAELGAFAVDTGKSIADFRALHRIKNNRGQTTVFGDGAASEAPIQEKYCPGSKPIRKPWPVPYFLLSPQGGLTVTIIIHTFPNNE